MRPYPRARKGSRVPGHSPRTGHVPPRLLPFFPCFLVIAGLQKGQTGPPPRHARAKRPARAQSRHLPRWSGGACLRPGGHRCGPRARPGVRARAVVPNGRSRARMGAPLRSRPHRPRSRPQPLSPGRGPQRARCRLGAGRRIEKPGADRRDRPNRSEGTLDRPPSRPCRQGLAYTLPAPLRPSRRGLAGSAHPLARRRHGKHARPL